MACTPAGDHTAGTGANDDQPSNGDDGVEAAAAATATPQPTGSGEMIETDDDPSPDSQDPPQSGDLDAGTDELPPKNGTYTPNDPKTLYDQTSDVAMQLALEVCACFEDDRSAEVVYGCARADGGEYAGFLVANPDGQRCVDEELEPEFEEQLSCHLEFLETLRACQSEQVPRSCASSLLLDFDCDLENPCEGLPRYEEFVTARRRCRSILYCEDGTEVTSGGWRCNHSAECPDLSDETNCGYALGPRQCAEVWVAAWSICDGSVDCDDGSDETECNLVTPSKSLDERIADERTRAFDSREPADLLARALCRQAAQILDADLEADFDVEALGQACGLRISSPEDPTTFLEPALKHPVLTEWPGPVFAVPDDAARVLAYFDESSLERYRTESAARVAEVVATPEDTARTSLAGETLDADFAELLDEGTVAFSVRCHAEGCVLDVQCADTSVPAWDERVVAVVVSRSSSSRLVDLDGGGATFLIDGEAFD